MPGGKVTAKKATVKSSSRNKNAAASHPPVNDMVKASIVSLKEKNGSSLQAIKKYIAANYEVNIQKLSPYINKCLNKAAEDGTLIRTKGKGASGSFKINLANAKTSESKKPTPTTTKAPKTKVVPKKATTTTTTKSKTKAAEKQGKKRTPGNETKKPSTGRQKPKKETVKAKKTPKRKRAKAKTVRLWLTKEEARSVPKKDWYRVFVSKHKL